MNPYETLGVKPSASQEEIKNAYRSLAKKLHPDLNPGNKSSEKKFKEVNAAYEMIGAAEARAKFDQGETEAQEEARSRHQESRKGPFYHETQGGPGGATGRYSQSFEGMDDDLFSSIFGNQRNPRKADELYQMSVDFKDSILGAEKEITLPNGKRLKVKIPAGIESGTRLRFAGQAQDQSKAAHDLYIEIQVNPSPIFTRDGNHIEIEVPISAVESILGGEIKVPTLEGAVLLKVPPLVSSGQKLRASGLGVRGKGDQLVRLKIVNPDPKTTTLDDVTRNSLKEWNARHPFDPRTEANFK